MLDLAQIIAVNRHRTTQARDCANLHELNQDELRIKHYAGFDAELAATKREKALNRRAALLASAGGAGSDPAFVHVCREILEDRQSEEEYTCGCGIYVHHSRRNPKAIHSKGCRFENPEVSK